MVRKLSIISAHFDTFTNFGTFQLISAYLEQILFWLISNLPVACACAHRFVGRLMYICEILTVLELRAMCLSNPPIGFEINFQDLTITKDDLQQFTADTGARSLQKVPSDRYDIGLQVAPRVCINRVESFLLGALGFGDVLFFVNIGLFG